MCPIVFLVIASTKALAPSLISSFLGYCKPHGDGTQQNSAEENSHLGRPTLGQGFNPVM